MMKKGLTKETVITEAVKLVKERGYNSLTLRMLASRLGVQPASLYNHVGGIEDVQLYVAEYAADRLEIMLDKAVLDLEGKAALKAASCAYMDFARGDTELYKALISMPKSGTGRSRGAGKKTFAIFVKIIHGYGIDEKNTLHLVRMLRSMMHGFFELCENGFMTNGRAKREDTFKFMIDEFAALLSRYGSEGK